MTRQHERSCLSRFIPVRSPVGHNASTERSVSNRFLIEGFKYDRACRGHRRRSPHHASWCRHESAAMPWSQDGGADSPPSSRIGRLGDIRGSEVRSAVLFEICQGTTSGSGQSCVVQLEFSSSASNWVSNGSPWPAPAQGMHPVASLRARRTADRARHARSRVVTAPRPCSRPRRAKDRSRPDRRSRRGARASSAPGSADRGTRSWSRPSSRAPGQ
jgi:hypothetical protein